MNGSPVSWRVELLPADARAGEAAVVVAVADINSGWHIYSLKRTSAGEPTTVSVMSDNCFSESGPAFEREGVAPADRKQEGAVQQRAVFGIPVRIRSGAKGELRATIRVRYQACTNELCRPPEVLELPLRLRVQDGAVRRDRAVISSELPPITVKVSPLEEGQLSVEPAARMLIDRVDAALARVKTLTCRVAFKRQDVWFGRRMGAVPSFSSPELLQYQAPNKFSFGHSYFCDGSVMGVNGERLLTEPAPASLASPMPDGAENVLRRFHVGVLRARDFTETARENAAVLRAAGLDYADGREGDVLEADGPAMTVRWFIGREEGLVHRIEVDARMWGGTGYRDEIAISDMTLDGRVDPSLFRPGPHKSQVPMHEQDIRDLLPLGAPVPDLRLVRVGGPFDPTHPNVEEVDLASVSRSHKATLVFLWSQRCGSCYFDLPVLQQIYKEFGDKGVAVLAIHTDMPGPYNNNDLLVQLQYERRWPQWGADALSQFVHELGYNFTMLYDPENKSLSAFYPQSKTFTWGLAVLIDTNGKIVWRGPPSLSQILLHLNQTLDR